MAESKVDCEAVGGTATCTESGTGQKWPMLVCRVSLNVLALTSLTALIDAVYLLAASSDTAITPQVLFVVSSIASMSFILLFCLSTRARNIDCCERRKSTLNHVCVLLAPGLIALWALSMGLDTGSNFSSNSQEAGLLILEMVIGVLAFLASVCLMLIVAFVKDCFRSTLLSISKTSSLPTVEDEKSSALVPSSLSGTSRPRSCLKSAAKSSSTTLSTESDFSQCSTVTNTPVLPNTQHVYRTTPSTTRRPISFTSILSSHPTTKPSFLSTVEETPLELGHHSSWEPEDLYPAPLRPRKELKRDFSPERTKPKMRVKRKSLKRIEPTRRQQSSLDSTSSHGTSHRSASTATSNTKIGGYDSSQSSVWSESRQSPHSRLSPASIRTAVPAHSELTALFEQNLTTPTKPQRPRIARSSPSYPPTSAVPPVPKIPEDLTSASDQMGQSEADTYREHQRKRKRGERRARQALVVSSGEVVLTQGAAPKVVKVRRVPEPSLSPSARRMSAMLEARLAASGIDADMPFDSQLGTSQWLAGQRMARSRTATTIMREAEEICRVFDADRFAHVRKSWASGRGLMLSLGRRKGESSKQDLVM